LTAVEKRDRDEKEVPGLVVDEERLGHDHDYRDDRDADHHARNGNSQSARFL
jgi:hypothetical protein